MSNTGVGISFVAENKENTRFPLMKLAVKRERKVLNHNYQIKCAVRNAINAAKAKYGNAKPRNLITMAEYG